MGVPSVRKMRYEGAAPGERPKAAPAGARQHASATAMMARRQGARRPSRTWTPSLRSMVEVLRCHASVQYQKGQGSGNSRTGEITPVENVWIAACKTCGYTDTPARRRLLGNGIPAACELLTPPSRVPSLDRGARSRRMHSALQTRRRCHPVAVHAHVDAEIRTGNRRPPLRHRGVAGPDQPVAGPDRRRPGMPSALMPFYGSTADEAATQLVRWLTLAHRGPAQTAP